jgi:hypothetical protein
MKSDSFLKSISIVIPLLVIAGLVNQVVYYRFFNINITDFLNSGEVLILFSDDILFYVLFIAIFFMVAILVMADFVGKGQRVKAHRKFLKFVKTESIFDRLVMELYRARVNWISWLVILVMIYLTEEKQIFDMPLLVVLVDFGATMVRFFALELKRELRIKGELKKDDRSFDQFFSMFTLSLSVLLMWSIYEARDVKFKYKFINTSFVVNDIPVLSDSSSFYIGKTHDYLFFYEKPKDRTVVYPMSSVSQLTFGKVNYAYMKKGGGRHEENVHKGDSTKQWWQIWK